MFKDTPQGHTYSCNHTNDNSICDTCLGKSKECCKDCRNGNCPTNIEGKRVCPCHKPSVEVSNLTPESTEMEEWESRFDKKYVSETWSKEQIEQYYNQTDEDTQAPFLKGIKQFISNLLSSHSKKLVSEYKKELIEKITKLSADCGGFKRSSDECFAYGKGLSEIYNIIKQ